MGVLTQPECQKYWSQWHYLQPYRPCLACATITEENKSGTEVPAAKIVKAIIDSGIFKLCAINNSRFNQEHNLMRQLLLLRKKNQVISFF